MFFKIIQVKSRNYNVGSRYLVYEYLNEGTKADLEDTREREAGGNGRGLLGLCNTYIRPSERSLARVTRGRSIFHEVTRMSPEITERLIGARFKLVPFCCATSRITRSNPVSGVLRIIFNKLTGVLTFLNKFTSYLYKNEKHNDNYC